MRLTQKFSGLSFRRPQFTRLSAPRGMFPLLGLACFLVAFLAGVLLWLPLSPLTGRLEQFAATNGAHLEITSPSLSFPPGLSAKRVTVETGNPLFPEVEVDNLALRPLWGSLLGKDPGAAFSGRTLGGQVAGQATRTGQLEIQWSGLSLQDQALSPQLSLKLSGSGGSGRFAGQVPLTGSRQASGELRFQEVLVSGLSALGSSKDVLRAGTLAAEISARGQQVKLDKLSLNGGELEASGSGTLILGNRPANSRINLDLTLRPGADLDPALRDLLNLFAKPAGDGTLRLRLSGSLANPQMQ